MKLHKILLLLLKHWLDAANQILSLRMWLVGIPDHGRRLYHPLLWNKKQNIKQLTDKTWEKIEKCATFYLDKPDSKCHSLSEKVSKFKAGGYHSTCYKRYTLVPSSGTSSATPTPSTSSSEQHLRSATSSISVSTAEVFADVCMFCNKRCIKVDQRKKYPTTSTLESAETFIKDLIKKNKDAEMSAKVGNIDFHA